MEILDTYIKKIKLIKGRKQILCISEHISESSILENIKEKEAKANETNFISIYQIYSDNPIEIKYLNRYPKTISAIETSEETIFIGFESGQVDYFPIKDLTTINLEERGKV